MSSLSFEYNRNAESSRGDLFLTVSETSFVSGSVEKYRPITAATTANALTWIKCVIYTYLNVLCVKQYFCCVNQCLFMSSSQISLNLLRTTTMSTEYMECTAETQSISPLRKVSRSWGTGILFTIQSILDIWFSLFEYWSFQAILYISPLKINNSNQCSCLFLTKFFEIFFLRWKSYWWHFFHSNSNLPLVNHEEWFRFSVMSFKYFLKLQVNRDALTVAERISIRRKFHERDSRCSIYQPVNELAFHHIVKYILKKTENHDPIMPLYMCRFLVNHT